MAKISNKIITSVLAPVYNCPVLPFLHIAKLFNKQKELIPLKKGEVYSEDDPIYLTAHRGVWSVAPQNSLPSYKKAVELGFYSAECDIRLTSDNQWVLIHNDDTNSMFCQRSKVNEITFEEFRSYKYKGGANFWKYKDLKVATLDEYLDVFVGSKTRPQIEIKAETYDLLYTVVDAIKAKGLEETAIIISFDLKQLEELHAIDSNIELWYLVDKITQENIDEAKAIGSNVWLSANFDNNTKDSIQLAVDNKIGVSFWTVNTVEDAKMLYGMGVRYIETDILCK